MKKLFLYIIASGIALTVLSCNKEQDNIVENEIKAGEEIELIGVINNETIDNSKTSYELSASKATFSWSQYDEIWLVVYNSSSTKQSKYRFYAKESTESSAFTADYTFDKDGQSPTSYSEIGGKAPDGGTWEQSGFAIYPVSVDASRGNTGDVPQRDDYLALASDNGSSETVSVSLSSSYTLSSLDNQLSSVPMIGLRDGSSNLYNFYPAVGLLAFTLADVPTSATAVRLTSFSDEEPLSGTFTLNSSDPSISMSRVTSANRTRTVTLPSRASTQDVTVYVALPVGTITNGLRIELLDGTDYPIFKRKYSSSLEIERGVIKTVALGTPEWKKLGTGKFIDNFLFGKIIAANNSYSDAIDNDIPDYVPVVIEQNIADPSQYRLVNPYATAMSQFGYSPRAETTPDTYLTLTIDASGNVTYDTHITGFTVDSKAYNVELVCTGTSSYDKLIAGTQTDAGVVQLAPKYQYNGTSTAYNQSGKTNMMHIIFPGAMSSYQPTLTCTSLSNINLTVAAPKTHLILSQKNAVQLGYSWAYNSGGVMYADYSSDQAGLDWSGYVNASGVWYLTWLVYNTDYTAVVHQGCIKLYEITSADAAALAGTYKFQSLYSLAPFDRSEWRDLTSSSDNRMVISVSDDETKGNVMITDLYGFLSDGTVTNVSLTDSANSSFELKASGCVSTWMDPAQFAAGQPVYGWLDSSDGKVYFENTTDNAFFVYDGTNYMLRKQDSSSPSSFSLTYDSSASPVTLTCDARICIVPSSYITGYVDGSRSLLLTSYAQSDSPGIVGEKQ